MPAKNHVEITIEELTRLKRIEEIAKSEIKNLDELLNPKPKKEIKKEKIKE